MACLHSALCFGAFSIASYVEESEDSGLLGYYLLYYCRRHTIYKISCIITTGYIWLHVSAIIRPTKNVVVKVHSTSFSSGIPLFTLKTLSLGVSMLMVEIITEYKIKL